MKRHEDIPVLRPYLDHPISTVRTAAAKAIAKLEKSTQ
jgi:HEAT repeat protein